MYCPSLQKKDAKGISTLMKRKCRHCFLYFSTIKAKKTHLSICKKEEATTEDDDHEECIDADEELVEGEIDESCGPQFSGRNIF